MALAQYKIKNLKLLLAGGIASSITASALYLVAQLQTTAGRALQPAIYLLVALLNCLLLASLFFIFRLGKENARAYLLMQNALEIEMDKRTKELARVNTILSSTADEFRTLADAVPQIVWTGRPDGTIDYANQRWYKYSGSAERAGENIDWAAWLHPDDLERSVATWIEALAGGQAYEVEYRLRNYSGAYRWFLCRATPIRDRQGQIIHWYGTNTDIDDQKNTMVQLSEGERIARSIFDLMPQLGWTASADGRVNFFNSRWYEYTGCSEDGTDLLWSGQIQHPDYLPQALERWHYCVLTRSSFTMKFPLKGIDGHYRWFLTRANPVLDQSGAVVRWVGINTDVDDEEKLARLLEQKVQERTAELNQSELRFRGIFNHAFQFTGLLSPDGTVLEANQALLDFSGAPKESLIGKQFAHLPWWNLTPGLSRQFESDIKAAAEGRFVRHEVAISEDVGSVTCDFSLKPIFDQDEKVVLLLPEGRDITELKNARDEAIRASELKSQFVGNISHEIRTPMSAILGLTELLVSESEGELKETAEHVLLSAQSLMTIVNDLLDFSKLEGGLFVAEKLEFSPLQMVNQLAANFADEAQDKCIKITIYIDDAIPLSLIGDREQLQRVLRHLLQNALKFTSGGKIEIVIKAINKVDDLLLVRFAVSDTGIGISEAQQKRLFQPFVQVDGSNTRRYGGTGIGLVLCKRIVEMLGGAINLESVEGRGSTFWFTVPFAQDALENEKASNTLIARKS